MFFGSFKGLETCTMLEELTLSRNCISKIDGKEMCLIFYIFLFMSFLEMSFHCLRRFFFIYI